MPLDVVRGFQLGVVGLQLDLAYGNLLLQFAIPPLQPRPPCPATKNAIPTISEKKVPVRISDQSNCHNCSVRPVANRPATDAIELATAATGSNTARYETRSREAFMVRQ